jgi:hypothetical protein
VTATREECRDIEVETIATSTRARAREGVCVCVGVCARAVNNSDIYTAANVSVTWFLYLIWIGIFCLLCCVSYVILFFYVMVQFRVTVFFSVLLYSSVILYSLLLFILLSSSSYVCVFDSIYCTLTLPPDVNPIAVNKYLYIYILKT